LEKRFPTQELLNVTKVIYSQYLLTPKVETIFPRHMACCNLGLGLATKVRAYKGTGQ